MLQNELNIITNLCHMSRLVINPDKTKSMIICSQQKRSRLVSDVMTLQIDSKIIESVNSFRILGVIIDKHLSWNDHVKYLSCSLKSVICAFRKIQPYLNYKFRLIFYNSYFVSRLTYCANVWGGALPKYLLERLYTIQKRAIRIVFNVDYKASTYLLFSKNNIFTLEKLLLINRGVYMYKILNNLAPNYLGDIFSKCTNVGGNNQRSCSNENLTLPGIKLETG